eukprot:scaffold68984_cov47-Attheya_sp.AAC.1
MSWPPLLSWCGSLYVAYHTVGSRLGYIAPRTKYATVVAYTQIAKWNLHTAEEILFRRSYSRLREKPSKSQQREVKLVTMGCASRPFSISTSPDQDHVSMGNGS